MANKYIASFGFLVACLITEALEASATKDVFAKYPNAYFIETGSYLGDGIQMAVDTGFVQIYSIELSFYYYQYCCHRFSHHPNVVIFQGDSTHVLPVLLEMIDAPATFWLDGHYSHGNTARGDNNSPIMSELESIRSHHIKTHTLLIDDVRLFGGEEFDFITLDQIIEKIYQINPGYQITFENGYVPNDILVAEIR